MFHITGARKAAFIANCAVESANFTKLQENLFYTTPERILKVFPSRVKTLAAAKHLTRNPKALANLVYAGRLGNGPTLSGDGWKYSGKGLFQLTGKANYVEAASALGKPYVEHPELLLEPEHAALTAAWYWYKTGCNIAIDKGDFSGVVLRINGPAKLHEAERFALYTELLQTA
jgi:putative chitinase